MSSNIGDKEYLNKRIPQNLKYQHVKTKLDTGCSLSRLEELKASSMGTHRVEASFTDVFILEEEDEDKDDPLDPDYRYREDELFKRLKVTTFAQLVLQVASVSDLNNSVNDEEPHGSEGRLSVFSEAEVERLSEHATDSPRASPTSAHLLDGNGEAVDAGYSARSTLQSVISGVGELDLNRNGQKTVSVTPVVSPVPADSPYPDCPYLLLDVRDRDKYDQCHIISAYSFPIAMLSRTMNPYTKEVLDYKNTVGKIIIVYDEDECVASQVATTMCERGFENLFILSGGLKVVTQIFPEGMTTGSIPASCLSSPTSTSGRKRRMPRPASQAAERRWRFTSDELAKIQQQLEEILVPSSGPNSKTTTPGISITFKTEIQTVS
ncbi:centrosomal protein of 41 kDa [Diretmus argenteus]